MISEQTDLLVWPTVHERYDPMMFESEKHTVIVYQFFLDVFWNVFTGDAGIKLEFGHCFFC